MGRYTSIETNGKPTVNHLVRNGRDLLLFVPGRHSQLLEELQYAYNLELEAINLPAVIHYRYERTNPSDPNDDANHPAIDGWEKDASAALWRQPFTPGPPFTNLNGFYALVSEQWKDLAQAVTNLFNGWDKDADQGRTQGGFSAFGGGSLSLGQNQAESSIAALRTGASGLPEFDDNHNVLTPKLCFAVLEDDKIKIYDYLGGALEASRNNGILDENLLGEFILRDETGAVLTGALSGTGSANGFTILFSGGVLRTFTPEGLPQKLPFPVNDFSITVSPLPEKLGTAAVENNFGGAVGKTVWISAGKLYSLEPGQPGNAKLRDVYAYPNGGTNVTSNPTSFNIIPLQNFPQSGFTDIYKKELFVFGAGSFGEDSINQFGLVLAGGEVVGVDGTAVVDWNDDLQIVSNYQFGEEMAGHINAPFPGATREGGEEKGKELSIITPAGNHRGHSIDRSTFYFSLARKDSVFFAPVTLAKFGNIGNFNSDFGFLDRRTICRIDLGEFDKLTTYGNAPLLDIYFRAFYYAVPIAEDLQPRTVKIHIYTGTKPPTSGNQAFLLTQWEALGFELGSFSAGTLNNWGEFRIHKISGIDVNQYRDGNSIWIIAVPQTDISAQFFEFPQPFGHLEAVQTFIRHNWK